MAVVMIKIFIADDHALIREGFKRILNMEKDIKVIGEGNNAFETISYVEKNDFDVLILDINLPDKNGLDVLKEVKIIKPELYVLILSMHPEERFAMRAIKAGASGYITKESAPDELVKAIRKVNGGGRYISTNLAEKMVFDMQSKMDKPIHEILSDREFQVLRFIASGKTMGEIAIELNLAVTTISTYRARILEKLNLKTNAELIHYTITNNLID
jgi:DNA-binding NarL/FixJ family response regulator